MNWTAEQIIALAPDNSSAKSGRGLASASKWQTRGANENAIWGECQGSGKNPYQTSIDLTEPTFKCSCPSRKFPCKHGLGLFLLWANQQNTFNKTQPPAWVSEWLEKREQQKERKAAKEANKDAEETDPAKLAQRDKAKAKRAGEREAKVADGIILCVDQSGSMAASVVYSSVMAAVMASIRSVKTSLVVFDTSIVDLTEMLQDPVEVLFGTQLGGGTDINLAMSYCQNLIRNPGDTILILISDLYEGGNAQELLKRVANIAASGVQMIALLALDDKGAPGFDSRIAAKFSSFGVPCFACTPDLFPDMMATAINKRDITQWAAAQGIVTSRAGA